jgi:putative MFS transporter
VAWGISLLIIGFFVSPAIIIIFGFIASTTIGLLVPMLYTYTAEQFSTNARATGVALTDGLGHVSAERSRRSSSSARTRRGASREHLS